jgi:hypothetical protein
MFRGVAVLAIGVAAFSAQASTAISCLLAVQVQEKFVQPIGQVIVKAKVLAVKDNAQGRNDSDCKALFASTPAVWLNVSSAHLRDKPPVIVQDTKMWARFNYGDSKGGAVWRDYAVITEADYLEK